MAINKVNEMVAAGIGGDDDRGPELGDESRNTPCSSHINSDMLYNDSSLVEDLKSLLPEERKAADDREIALLHDSIDPAVGIVENIADGNHDVWRGDADGLAQIACGGVMSFAKAGRENQ